MPIYLLCAAWTGVMPIFSGHSALLCGAPCPIFQGAVPHLSGRCALPFRLRRPTILPAAAAASYLRDDQFRGIHRSLQHLIDAVL